MLDSLMKKLSPEDQKKVKSLLSNREECSRILASPEAQKLLRKLTGGK